MRRRLERFFFAPARPINLAMMRIALFSVVAYYALIGNVESVHRQAEISWSPTSFFTLLERPPSLGALTAVKWSLFVAAVLAAVGLWTRAAQWTATPLAAFLFGFSSNFGKINHRSMLIVLLLLALLPARLGDAVSLDALRRRTFAGAHWRYRWPVALTQVTVVSVYVFAGLSKILNGGPDWFAAESFQRLLYVRLDQLPDPPRAGLWLAAQPLLAQASAFGMVAIELSSALMLVRPALARVLLPTLALFHEVTRRLVRIDFTQMLAVAWIPFVNWEWVAEVVLRAVGRRGPTRTPRTRTSQRWQRPQPLHR